MTTTTNSNVTTLGKAISSIAHGVASTLNIRKREPGTPIQATDLLTEQHEEVDALFKKFEDAKDAQKPAIFARIAATLVAHDAIERELFYPACENALGKDDDSLDESLVEHGLVEFSIFRADECQDSAYFDSYVHVLKEVVHHHVKEEQAELFPKVKKAMKKDDLLALGAKMDVRFAQALKEPWRPSLRANLEQALAGATKTKKKAAPVARTVAQKVKGKKSGN